MYWLDNSRIIAIYAVIFLHVSAAVLAGNELGTGEWWIGNFYDSITRWCVPVFVMISGALLLDPEKKESMKTFYRKRCDRLVIPIIFWSIIFLIWNVLRNITLGIDISVSDLVKSFFSGKPHYHMWFLFMIAFLYLFTPFFRKIVSAATRAELFFLVSVLFFIAVFNYTYGYFYSGISELFINWFLQYLPYFFFGHFLRQENKRYPLFIVTCIFIISLFLTSAGFYLFYRDFNMGGYFYGYLSITVVPMSLSAMYLLKRYNRPVLGKKITAGLSTLTLGVYLVHPLFLESLNYMKCGVTILNPAVSVPLITTAVFLMSLTASWIISQIPFLRKTI